MEFKKWNLNLAAAVASIVGTAELYVRTGSTISLTCIIQGSGTIPPRILFWFHNSRPSKKDYFLYYYYCFFLLLLLLLLLLLILLLCPRRMIYYLYADLLYLFVMHTVALDSPRGGISLETERTTTGMSSKLLLTRATLQDAGPSSSYFSDII